MKPDLSRRQFLAHSAGIAGVSLGLGGRVAADSEGGAPLRLGIVGLGDRGRHLLGAVLRLEEFCGVGESPVEVVAVCDVHPERLKKALDLVARGGGTRKGGTRKGGNRKSLGNSRGDPDAATAERSGGGRRGRKIRGYTQYRALLDATDVDAVIVATPVHLHAKQTVATLLAGKHVYLEKPLASTVEECREIRAASREAARKGLVFQIGFQRRYNPRYCLSVQHVHEGRCGDPLFVRAQWHATGNSPKDKPWIFRKEKSGDIVVEQACHQFDIFNWVFQSVPERVCGMGGTHRFHDSPPGRDTMDHYGLVLEYPGGAKVHFSHLSYAIPDRRFSGIYELVFAENGGIDLANAQTWTRDGKARKLESVAGGKLGNDTEIAISAFAECVRRGLRPVADIDVAYQATVTSLLCRRALDTGQTVRWNEIEPV